jgi:beta-lactamase superfamily II metal-dependent hydrolase
MANKKSSNKRSSSSKSTASKAKRQAVKYAKKNKKGVIIAVAVLVIIIALAVLVTYLVKPQFIQDILNRVDSTITDGSGNNGGTGDSSSGGSSGSSSSGGSSSGTTEGSITDISSADLSIHFLELGVANAGDCVLIKCGDTEVLIDAGAKSTTAPTSRMIEYINQYCTDGKLEYVIATHGHEDHIAGLVGQASGSTRTGILYQYEIGTIIQFAGHNTSSKIYNNYVSAVEYAVSQGATAYTALQCWNETDGASKTYYLDDNQTISLNILYQKYYESTASTENNYSVCTMITQEVDGSTYNYLFTGDLEEAGEKSLAASNDLPHCVLYKGGHHGSSTSSNDVLLSKITPDNIAICTCAGTYEYANKPTSEYPDRYLNTFPTQEAIERMSLYTDKIYVTSLGIIDDSYATTGFTSMNGDIVFYYNKTDDEESGSLKLWCSNNTTILKDTEWFKQYRNMPSSWA